MICRSVVGAICRVRSRLLLGSVLLVSVLQATIPCASRAQSAKRAAKPRVIQLEEIRIEGRVQKPNAFYILNRSNLGYEVLEMRTSFLRNVVQSVQAEPF